MWLFLLTCCAWGPRGLALYCPVATPCFSEELTYRRRLASCQGTEQLCGSFQTCTCDFAQLSKRHIPVQKLHRVGLCVPQECAGAQEWGPPPTAKPGGALPQPAWLWKLPTHRPSPTWGKSDERVLSVGHPEPSWTFYPAGVLVLGRHGTIYPGGVLILGTRGTVYT